MKHRPVRAPGKQRGNPDAAIRIATIGPASIPSSTRREETKVIRRVGFEQILASMQEAVFDDTRWPTTSGLIDEACRIKGNALLFTDQSSVGDVEVFFTMFCYRGQRHRELEHMYFDVYHPMDERLPRVRQLPDSQLAHVADMYSKQERKTSPAYNEWLVHAGRQNSLNVRLDGPDGSRIVLTTADSRRGALVLGPDRTESSVFYPIFVSSSGSGTRWSTQGRLATRSPTCWTTRVPA